MFKLLVAFSILACVYGDNSFNYNNEPPRPYQYQYAVNDANSGANFNAQESSNGNVVTGSYQVQLPDGRLQIVTYTADENGYVADVRYEGTAVYPKYEPKPFNSKYAN